MLKNIKYIIVFTTFLIAAWIFLGVYHNLTTSTVSQDTKTVILPISSTFDLKTLRDIQKRKKMVIDLNTISQPATQSPVLIAPRIPNAPASQSSQIQPTPPL